MPVTLEIPAIRKIPEGTWRPSGVNQLGDADDRKTPASVPDPIGPGKSGFSDQLKKLVRRHFSAHVGAVEEAVGQCPFCLVQGHYFFFDRVPGDQPVNGNRPFLTDPVGAVGCLVLHGRVPPGIHVDDVIGGGQVQPESAGFQADEKQVAFTALEGGDTPVAFFLRRASVQILVADRPGFHIFAYKVEMSR